MPRFLFSLVAAVALPACGSAPHRLGEPLPVAPSSARPSEPLAPIQAGSYKLRMSVPCGDDERSATGTLSLKRLSGSEAPISRAGDGTLLWGQTDIDFEQLRACLSGPVIASEEPIHPSVLVEVLHWDGAPQGQVLLTSTDSRPGVSSSGAGVALWVATVSGRHVTGVWSRWALKRAVEGRFEAELTSGESPR